MSVELLLESAGPRRHVGHLQEIASAVRVSFVLVFQFGPPIIEAQS